MPVVAPSRTSPNIGNYRVGRGYMTMELQGETGFLDMGNVTSMTFEVKPTLLHHYSSRVGVQSKDRSVVTRTEATLTVVAEEWTARNMGLALLGNVLQSGADQIDIMSQPLFYCALNFTDTNVTGPQWQAFFPLCLITPSKAIEMIAEGSGNWGALTFTVDVQKDTTQGFGWFTCENFAS